MFRIVRTRTLNALRTDLATAQARAEATSKEAGDWHRLYQEESGRAADAAIREEDTRAELEEARDELARAHTDRIAAERERNEARQGLGRLQPVLEAIAAALVTAPDAERARQEAARLVQRHGDRAVLGALAGELDLLCLGPAVHLYLRRAEIRSAHTTRESARRAAEAEGAQPSGWLPGRTVESARDDEPLTDYATRSLPVQGEWPDRGRVHLLVREDGRPFSAHGTRESADALAEVVLSAHGLTLARTELAVTTAQPAPTPA